MNRLASILPAAQVLVSVDATSKKRAFEEAGLLFENLYGLSRALVTDSLFSRERLGSTGLGHGVAIPHGRIKGLKAPMAAVFQLAHTAVVEEVAVLVDLDSFAAAAVPDTVAVVVSTVAVAAAAEAAPETVVVLDVAAVPETVVAVAPPHFLVCTLLPHHHQHRYKRH